MKRLNKIAQECATTQKILERYEAGAITEQEAFTQIIKHKHKMNKLYEDAYSKLLAKR